MNIFLKFASAILNNDTHGIFNIINEIILKGFQEVNLLVGLSEHFRSILCHKLAIISNDEHLSIAEEYISQAKKFTNQQIIHILNILKNAELDLKGLKK